MDRIKRLTFAGLGASGKKTTARMAEAILRRELGRSLRRNTTRRVPN